VVRLTHIAVAVAVILAAVMVFRYLLPSAERQVVRQFGRLSESVAKSPDEKPFEMTRKMRRLRALFNDPCEFSSHLDVLTGTYSPEELSALAVRGRAQFSRLELTFYDLDVEFPEERTAKVMLTATLRGHLVNGDAANETREMESTLRKVEGDWVFSAFQVVEVLRR
jgi:hypothetical protein